MHHAHPHSGPRPDAGSPRGRALSWWAVGLALAACAALAYLVHCIESGTGVVVMDLRITDAVVAHRTEMLDAVASAVSLFGNEVTLFLLTLATAATLWWRGSRLQSAFLVAAMTGSAVLTVVVKQAVGRARPPVEDVVGEVFDPSYSFPSGHTLNSAVFIAALLVVVLPTIGSRAARASAVALGAFVALGVGASRVYLGFHWTSDVLGAWLVAWVWMVVLCTSARLMAPGLTRESRAPSARSHEGTREHGSDLAATRQPARAPAPAPAPRSGPRG